MSHTARCRFVAETDAAVKVRLLDRDDEEVWFPLSQVDQMHRDRDGVGQIVVTDWIARQKGLT